MRIGWRTQAFRVTGELARDNVEFRVADIYHSAERWVPLRRTRQHRTVAAAGDMIVIGSSAGGVRALQMLFSSLPGDLAAAVFVVLHTAPHRDSHLAEVLNFASALPVVTGKDGEPIVHSRAC
jgi:chemotaxis response regulator CheB